MLLYQSYQAQCDLSAPMRAAATVTRRALDELPPSLSKTDLVRRLSSASELMTRARLTHVRPPFGISSVTVGDQRDKSVEVVEETVESSPFASLLHFRKETDAPRAPGAGRGRPRRPLRDAACADRADPPA